MDAAERWLKMNDPRYAQEKAKELRKKRDRANYYKGISQSPPRSKMKKFPKGDGC